MSEIGKRLKSLRLGKGLKLRQVEVLTSVSNAYLSQLESGKVANPSVKKLRALADFYGVALEYIERGGQADVMDIRDSDRSEFSTGAVRSADANHVRYDLVSPVGLRRLAETYAEGAAKYGANNWRNGFPFSNLLNHLQNHIEMFKLGDTSEDHLAHAAWGLFALMDFQETMPEMDDRYKTAAKP